MGKGCKRRHGDDNKYRENWDRIFVANNTAACNNREDDFNIHGDQCFICKAFGDIANCVDVRRPHR